MSIPNFDIKVQDALHDLMQIGEFIYENNLINHVPPEKLDMTIKLSCVVFLDLIYQRLNQIKRILDKQ